MDGSEDNSSPHDQRPAPPDGSMLPLAPVGVPPEARPAGREWKKTVAIAGVVFAVLLLAVGVRAIFTSSQPTDAYGYTLAIRDSFVAGCTKAGGSQAVCSCAFHELERRYTPDELQAEAKRYQETGAFSDATIDAVRSCL